MFNRSMTCRVCGTALDGGNIGYVSTSNGNSIFECRTCHVSPNANEPRPTFKSWRILRRQLNV